MLKVGGGRKCLRNSKSLCKNMARASGGANNMHSLSWGGGGDGRDPINFGYHDSSIPLHNLNENLIVLFHMGEGKIPTKQ